MNVAANDTGCVDIKSKDEAGLTDAIAHIGPISVAMDASHISFQVHMPDNCNMKYNIIMLIFFCSSTEKVFISHSSALKIDWTTVSWLLAMAHMKARTSLLSRTGL